MPGNVIFQLPPVKVFVKGWPQSELYLIERAEHTIYVTSFSVFHTEVTGSIGLRNIPRSTVII